MDVRRGFSSDVLIVLMFICRYLRKIKRKRTGATEFLYNCAQSVSRQDGLKTTQPGKKPRTTRRMDRFNCEGYLRITVDPGSEEMLITMRHEEEHMPYLDIEIPDAWKEYIEEHAKNETPRQVRRVRRLGNIR